MATGMCICPKLWKHWRHFLDMTPQEGVCQENKLRTNHWLFSFKTESQGFITRKLKNCQPKNNNCSRRKNSKSGRSQDPSFPAFCFFCWSNGWGVVTSLLGGIGGCFRRWLTRSNSSKSWGKGSDQTNKVVQSRWELEPQKNGAKPNMQIYTIIFNNLS